VRQAAICRGNLRGQKELARYRRHGGSQVNSLKTGVIIAFGLTVLYGVYLVINKPQPTAEAKAEADTIEDLSIGEVDESSEVVRSDDEHDGHSAGAHEGDAKVEVALKERGGSRFGKREQPEAPAEGELMELESSDPLKEETEAEGTAPESKELEVAPWRNKTDSATEPDAESASKSRPRDTEIEDAEVAEAPRSRFGGKKKTEEEAAADPEEEATSPPLNEETMKEEETSEVAETEDQATTKPEVKIAPREAPALGAAEFDAAWTKMEQEIEEGKFKEALATISPFFHATDLSADDSKQLLEVLDLLAWRVVFSKEHYLAKPHIVAAGETLEDIAAKYDVPTEVISKINGLKSARLLTAGTELKVLPGPFRAEVSVERGELTLFLGDLYATRYAVEAGTEPPPAEGEYSVVRRAPGATYPTKENREIAAQDPRNPYGGVFLDLGNDQCIHGSPEKESGEELGSGCMRLRGKDAKEVYWLLSKGSKVTVMR
jgi:LysM repeat protein